MIIYINSKGEIKDVDSTSQDNLTAIVLADEDNPFIGWSNAKICCYRVQIIDGRVAMFTPYIDTRMVEQLDRLSVVDEATELYNEDQDDALIELSETTIEESQTLEDAIAELYDMISALTE